MILCVPSVLFAQFWGSTTSGTVTHTPGSSAIGRTSLEPNTKLFINNTDKANGLRIDNSLTSTGFKYGIQSTITNGTGNKYAISAEIASSGFERAYGIFSNTTGSNPNLFAGYFLGKSYFSDKILLGTLAELGRLTIESATGTGIYVGNTATGETAYGITIKTPELTRAISVGSLTANNQFVVLGNGNFSGKRMTATSGDILLNENVDFSEGFKISANRLLTKAFVINDNAGLNKFIVWGNGNVNTKLLYAEGIKVKSDAIGSYWPDYVFQKEYKLLPLEKLEEYIAVNKHLPEVPSSNEVETNGVDLMQMNAALLKKIEELTLYTIDLQKQINELK